MKKIIITFFTLVLSLSLVSCTNKTTSIKGTLKEERKVSILSPNGSPALSLMYIENVKDSYNYQIDYVDGADPLTAAFTSKSYDFIFAPLNLGAKMYRNNGNYKLLSEVVSCNYYFATVTSEDFTMESLSSKSLVIFGENAVSGIIARYVISNSALDITKMDITYVNSVQDAQSELVKNPSKVILTAEPSLSILKSKISGIKTISILDTYTSITKKTVLAQAACFVRSDIESGIAERFSSYLENSIDQVNNHPSESAVLGHSIFNNFSEKALLVAIPQMNLKYVSSKNAKNDCADFFTLLNSVNPKLIGGDIDDGFYY